MPKVWISATMETDLTWTGFIPDDVPEDERREWIVENVDGGDFTQDEGMWNGSWNLSHDVNLVEDDWCQACENGTCSDLSPTET